MAKPPVAVNVIELPVQMLLSFAVNPEFSLAVNKPEGNGFTVVVIALLVAGLPDTQEALEVSTHVIAFPGTKEVVT